VVSVRFVEEIVVDEFLPTFRAMLAERLRDRGLTQREVADLLGISQSAVSKYAHGGVDRHPRVEADDRVCDLADRLAEGLADGTVSPVQALVEAEVLIRQLERGDLLASLHEDAMPALAEYGPVAVHDPEGAFRTAERVRASVRRGLRTLENTGGFAGLIPAVGSNLVECLPDAAGIEDVVAVPGRILDVKGRATVPAEPEFGASGHVSSVLLAARAAGSDARAALNIRYTPGIVDRIESGGLVAAAFDPDLDLEEGVAAALAETPDAGVLYQTGGFGVEPIVYVFAPDAPTAVERIHTLV
jgi:predicted fused transcriptional regulator/phosphomethylpyrimidine kinase/predicted transcriptional regulator